MRLAAVALQLALLAFAAQHACADPFTPDALAGSHADQKQPGSGLQVRADRNWPGECMMHYLPPAGALAATGALALGL